jgi:hypothetical protein
LNTTEAINENQEMKRKISEAAHQIGILELQLSNKKVQFQENMAETKKNMKQMQEVYEMKIEEMNQKINEVQKQNEVSYRNFFENAHVLSC